MTSGFLSIWQVMEETSKQILQLVPDPVPEEPVMKKYPVLYEQSMNTVLIQEIFRSERKKFIRD